ncbi:MAG: hypothetical protein ISR77_36550 [Pirellulaceae bacterium]|nr:hypothetical protein [Pirellulaceae bacterium]
MQRASQLFTDEQRRRIDQAVVDAEAKTSAEIVPVVATASGRYDRAEDVVGLWLAIVTAVVLWIWLPRPGYEAGSWSGCPVMWQIVGLPAGMVAAFVLGAVMGSKIGWLRRLFTPQREMREEVSRRAREVFFDNRIHHTAGATGLLLYVSLFEHMAAVIADQNVLEKLGQPAVDELCAELTNGLHAGHPTDAFCDALASAGRRLGGVLPRAEDDANELADALIALD